MDSDLIRGNVDTIILKCLANGEMYGIEICKFVRDSSGGEFELKAPTLYSALKRLQDQKLVSSYWRDSSIGGRRHYYALTEFGKERLANKKDHWKSSKDLIDNLVLDTHAVKQAENTVEIAQKVPIPVSFDVYANERDIMQPATVAASVSINSGEESRVVVTARQIEPLEKYIATSDYITVPLVANVDENTKIASPIPPPPVNNNTTQFITPVKSSVPLPSLEPYTTVKDYPIAPLPSSTIIDKAATVTQLAIAIPDTLPHVDLKPFVKHASDKRSGRFILYNKLRLFCSFLVCAALAAGLVCSSIFLKDSYTRSENSFFALGWICAGVYLLANIAMYSAYPKYKRIIKPRTRDLVSRGVLMLCVACGAICINIIAGLSQITADYFLVFWVVPCILSTAFLFEGMAIWALRRMRPFLT